jgi:hypothetical protein
MALLDGILFQMPIALCLEANLMKTEEFKSMKTAAQAALVF